MGSYCGDAVNESRWDTPGPVQATFVQGQAVDIDVVVAVNHLVCGFGEHWGRGWLFMRDVEGTLSHSSNAPTYMLSAGDNCRHTAKNHPPSMQVEGCFPCQVCLCTMSLL